MVYTIKNILILTPFFFPDPGVSSHLDDLIVGLSKKGFKVYINTLACIPSKGIKTQEYFKNLYDSKNIALTRFYWIGFHLFDRLEKYPILQFIYLCPYFFIRSFIWMMFNNKNVDVIHANGLSAIFTGILLKKIFKKRLIASIHAIYEVEKKSKTAKNIVSLLKNADKVLCLSKGAYNQLLSLGVDKDKLYIFKYWIDLNKFHPLDQHKIRSELNIEDKFTVLFVGRLIEKKGFKLLVEIAKELSYINFLFIGSGIDDDYLRNTAKTCNNVRFIGFVDNTQIYKYYNTANIFCIPSLYEEGFGKVTIEALACGIPVVGSNKGAIKEALNKSVSILFNPTIVNIKKAILKLYKDKELYNRLKHNCRKYAEENFSEDNIKVIIKEYGEK